MYMYMYLYFRAIHLAEEYDLEPDPKYRVSTIIKILKIITFVLFL